MNLYLLHSRGKVMMEMWVKFHFFHDKLFVYEVLSNITENKRRGFPKLC